MIRGVRDPLLLLLLILLPLVACRRMIAAALLDYHNKISEYRYALLVPNYFDHGFVRRGFSGTLAELIERIVPEHLVDSLLMFHILSAAWLALPLVLLLRRLAKVDTTWPWLALLLLFSPQLFNGWAGDIGRSDMMVGGFIAWALILFLRGRYLLTAGILVTASLVHELAIIYGVPLVAACWLLDDRPRQEKARLVFPAAAALAAALILIAIVHSLSAISPEELATAIKLERPQSPSRDLAVYMTTSGFRSIVTSLCQSYGRSATPWYLFANFAILAAYSQVLMLRSGRALFLMAVASAFPLFAISMVAIDYGRWLMMAVLNAWLLTVTMRLTGDEQPPSSLRTYGVAAVFLGALMAMSAARVYAANDFVRTVGIRIWGETGVTLRPLEECDPEWHSVIGENREFL